MMQLTLLLRRNMVTLLVFQILNFFPLILSKKNNSEIIIGNENSTNLLEFYLCRNGLQSGMTITLLPFVNYTLSFDDFCVIQNVSNVSIRAAHDQAFLYCIGSESGIGFFNTTNLYMENLSISGCGGEIKLPANVDYYTNESNVYIGSKQKAVLFFSHCQNTQILSVTVTKYRGIGILLINQYGNANTVTNTRVADKSICQDTPVLLMDFSCAGSGIVFVYIDTNYSSISQKVQLALLNSSFTTNSQAFSADINILNLFGRGYAETPILSGAGLTLIMASNTHSINALMDRINIIGNYNTDIGAILIVYHRTALVHVIEISHLNITENYLIPLYEKQGVSTGVTFLVSASRHEADQTCDRSLRSSITISESIFESNFGTRGVGILFISQPFSYVNVNFTLRNCTFFYNRATDSGSALYFEVSQIGYDNNPEKSYLSVHLSNITAASNSFWVTTLFINSHKRYYFGIPVFSFINVPKVTVQNCNMSNNNGSAIQIYNGVLEIEDAFVCENNTSLYGGCLLLKGLSYLVLTRNTNAHFKGNEALVSGGAIYGDTLQISTDVCTIQPYNGTDGTFVYPLVFENNHANVDGDDIKITNIYDCSLLFNKSLQYMMSRNHIDFYKKIFLFEKNHSRAISGKEKIFRISENYKTIFSGQTVTVHVCAIDDGGKEVSATILVSVISYDTNLIELQGEQVYHNLNPGWNTLKLTLISKTTKILSGKIRLQGTLDLKAIVGIDIQMLPCPIGFESSEHNQDRCGCSLFLQNLGQKITCEIENATIQLPPSSWFGEGTNFNSSEAFSPSCPPDYCYTDRSSSYNSTTPDPLCRYNRTGIMCSQCQPGFSQVFGSNQCEKCSNLWLITALMHMIIGLIVVLFLFHTKLTLASGLFGGVIFFANMSAVSLHSNLLSSSLYTLLVKMLMAALNLNMGYSICFYNGMDSITKMALQLAFPLYLWCIVFVLVVISRCSTKVSNLIVGSSVQVLVTLIHLSFAKLLLIVTDILTSEQVFLSPNGSPHLVWYFDGNELYFSGRHLALFCASMIILIAFILPYLLFTTVVSPIGRCCSISHRLNPLIDVFCGPYKTGYRYWFGLRLWIVTMLYVVYAALRGTHPQAMLIIYIVTTFLFLTVQIYVKPFNSKINNIVDSAFIYLICVTDILTYFFIKSNSIGSKQSSIWIGLLLSVYLLLVSIIIVYYSLMANKKTRKLMLKAFDFFIQIRVRCYRHDYETDYQRMYRYEVDECEEAEG